MVTLLVTTRLEMRNDECQMGPRSNFAEIIALGAITMLFACAERQPRAIAVEQPYDDRLSCIQIVSERAANRRTVASYATDRMQQNDRNAMSVIAAPVNPLFLMHMDTGNAASREIAAYEQRLARLDRLGQERGCQNE